MSVVIDHVSLDDSVPGTSSTLIWTHATSGSPTGVGIGVAWRDANANITITSVTYGGLACTHESTQAFESDINKVALYSLANPPSGSQVVRVDFSGSCDRKSTVYAVSVVGGSTSDVFDTVSTNTGTSATITVDITSSVNAIVMDIAAAVGNITGVGANQTQRMNNALNGSEAIGSTEPGVDGVGGVTMSHTIAGSTVWGTVAGSFAPSAGTGTEPLSTSASTGGQTTPSVSNTVAL